MIPVGGSPLPTMSRVRMPGMNDKALQALTKAWIMTVIATALLSVALAVSPVWDSAGYLRALPGALSLGQ
jgi:ABC-type arginine transport system permease subunit